MYNQKRFYIFEKEITTELFKKPKQNEKFNNYYQDSNFNSNRIRNVLYVGFFWNPFRLETMKTITVTQEEFDKVLSVYDNNRRELEWHLEVLLSATKSNSERYYKAKLMLSKLTFEKYDTDSILIDGKGADRFIIYMEYKDGTPLTEDELQALDYDLHNDLMVAKTQGI